MCIHAEYFTSFLEFLGVVQVGLEQGGGIFIISGTYVCIVYIHIHKQIHIRIHAVTHTTQVLSRTLSHTYTYTYTHTYTCTTQTTQALGQEGPHIHTHIHIHIHIRIHAVTHTTRVLSKTLLVAWRNICAYTIVMATWEWTCKRQVHIHTYMICAYMNAVATWEWTSTHTYMICARMWSWWPHENERARGKYAYIHDMCTYVIVMATWKWMCKSYCPLKNNWDSHNGFQRFSSRTLAQKSVENRWASPNYFAIGSM